jgi:hypothetical protein
MGSARLEAPAIRAGWTQGLIGALEEYIASERVEVILQQMGAEAVARIRSMKELDWLDIETHIRLLESMLGVLGRAEYVAFYRRTSVEIMRSHFLSAIAVAGVRALGRSAILHTLPRGWNLVIRGCGRLSVRRPPDAGYVEVTLAEIPPGVATSEAIRLGTAAVLAAACDLGGYPARVQVDPDKPRHCTFVYRVSLVDTAAEAPES